MLGIMTDQAAPSGSRVRAAQCVVELSQESFELEDLEVTYLKSGANKEERQWLRTELRPCVGDYGDWKKG
jgi:hypothetical protein